MTTQGHSEDSLLEWRQSARYWEKHASTIRAMFASLTKALVQEAGIIQGHKVLDVAGGPGEPSLTLAEIVGPSGSVTCTDAIAEMVNAAASEARRRGLTNLTFRQCLADALPFERNSFDAVVSRFGAMFFPEPVVALREMLRVAKPGGVVSLAVWHKSDANPFSCVVTKVTSRYGPSPAGASGALDAFRFAEGGVLADIFQQAGANDVRERVVKFLIEAPIGPVEFWAMRSETSQTLREKLRALSVGERIRVGQEVQEAAREFFPNNQMCFPAQVLIVTGNKPR